MRATSPSSHSRQSAPASSSQQLDTAVSRRNSLNPVSLFLNPPNCPEDSGLIIYESVSRAPGSSKSSREVPIFPIPPSRELSRSTRSIVHDLHSTSTHSPTRLFDAPLQASRTSYDPASTHEIAQPRTADTVAGETAKPRTMLNPNASDSSGRPSSRGHSYSNTSRRGPPRHQPQQQPPPQVFEPPICYASLQDLPRGFSAQYLQSGAQFGPRVPLLTPPSQYTLSSGPRMQSGSTQYGYPSHPGLHAQDASMRPQNQLHGYFTGALAPALHPPYSYTPGQSPWEVTSSSAGIGHSYFGSGVDPTMQAPYPTSHPSTPFYASSQPITPPYSVPWSYAPHYSTPQFVHSPTTLAPSNNMPHQTPYSYEQSYQSPASALPDSDTSHNEGTWWYLPHGTRPIPLPRYDSYSPQPYGTYGSAQMTHEVDPHGHTLQSVSPGVVLPPDPVLPPRIPSPTQQQLPSIHPPPLPKQQSAPNPSPSPPLNFNLGPISRSLCEPARLQATHSASISSRARLARPPSLSRKPYHPSPPADCSEWVMWVGNVPSGATQDELLKFFSKDHPHAGPVASAGSAPVKLPFPSSPLSSLADVSTSSSRVQSIFLISRSQCAFVNYASEQHLHAAISRFNGKRLHPQDVHDPVLVCRVRAREDDLKTGVGGQRGAGVHSKWVKEQRAKAKAIRAAKSWEVKPLLDHGVATSSGSYLVGAAPPNISKSLNLDSAGAVGTVAGRGARRTFVSGTKTASARSDSSESHASTNSGMLMRHFPKRYFILKSLSQFDLDLSVERGLWATQKHNEVILDQAYRTSRDVYLIFGVNKSGEFYGYARMAGLIYKVHDEQGSDRGVSSESHLSIESPPPWQEATGRPSISLSSRRPTMPYILSSDGPRSEESPLPMNVLKRSKLDHHSKSAPAVMLRPHNPLSAASTGPRHGGRSFDPILPPARLVVRQSQAQPEEFMLDPKAPERAVKQRLVKKDSTGVKSWNAVPQMSGTSHVISAEDEEQGDESISFVDKGKGGARKGDDEQGCDGKEKGANVAMQKGEDRSDWGEPFRAEWIKAARLPFHRTRHLRNPWNHDREVKISRDGTELEPSVGQALLDEWDKPELSPPIRLPGRTRTRTNSSNAAQMKEGGPGPP